MEFVIFPALYKLTLIYYVIYTMTVPLSMTGLQHFIGQSEAFLEQWNKLRFL